MTTSTESLVRPSVRQLEPYASARSLTTEGSIFLDANEASDSFALGINRYPEPQPRALVARFSEMHGVRPSQIVVGRGSDEAIDLVVRAFAEPRIDRILVCPPTYGVYEIAAAIAGCEATRVPLVNSGGTFTLDVERVIAQSEKLIFLCSPNNPTGTAFDPDVLESIALRTRGRSIVVIDEAYAEFSERASLVPALDRHPNLVVLRTLSKAWALAGARVGIALASEEIVRVLARVRAPYPISTPQADLALLAIAPSREQRLRDYVASVRTLRDRLARDLMHVPGVVYVWPSEANFLLVRFTPSGHARFLERTRARGIIVRNRTREAGLESCIRITVGSAEENALLLEVTR